MKKWLLMVGIMVVITITTLNAQASDRIVTLGGDVTEIVFALGSGSQVVARDSTSRHPEAAFKLPDVGYMRMLNAEGVLSMHPTLVIASALAKPSMALSQIEKNGVRVIKVTGVPTLKAIPDKISTIASALGKTEQGKELIQRFNQELSKVNTTSINKKIMFIMSHSGVLPLAAGKQTAADSMILALGAQNALSEFNHYRPLSPEGVIASQPDLIIVGKESIKSLGGIDKIWLLPGIAMTTAAKNKALLVVDDMGMLSFSLGTPAVMNQIREALEKLP